MSLSENSEQQKRRYGSFVFAVFLLLFAAVAFIAGSHNFVLRSLAIVAIMISVYLVRASNVHSRPTPAVASVREVSFNTTSGPGRSTWVISIVLVPMLVVSYLLLQSDALHGGHSRWPADLFAGVAFACAIAWSFLVMKLTSGRR